MSKTKFNCICITALAGILLYTIGCKNTRPSRVPVSGRVLLDGKPLPCGHVRFVPKNGRASTAKIDKDGRFTLTCFAENDGAVVGTHQVEVSASEAISETQSRLYTPEKYGSAETSGIVLEVKDATDNLEIKLESGNVKYPVIKTVE